MTTRDDRAAVQSWRQAGRALEDVRRRELRELTDAEALAAAEALLGLLSYAPPKAEGSGLVEQQRVFARARAR
jgi:hypothetical protein